MAIRPSSSDDLPAIVSGIAHRLRSTATALDGQLACLRHGPEGSPLTPESLDYLEEAARHVVEASQLLEQLTSDHRAASRVLDFGATVRCGVRMMHRALPARFTLDHHGERGSGRFVYASEDDLVDLVIQLVARAWRLTGDGGSARLEASDTADRVVLRLTVPGEGFELHTGLEDLIGRLGAELSCQSAGGVTEVVVRIGAVASGGPVPGRPAGEEGSGQRVLIADDDRQIRSIVATMLDAAGFEAIQAADGRDAVQRFRDTAQVRCAVIDIDMPVMDGLECIGLLRGLDPTVPIVVISGAGNLQADLPDDVDVLSKPFRMHELIARVRTAVVSGQEAR